MVINTCEKRERARKKGRRREREIIKINTALSLLANIVNKKSWTYREADFKQLNTKEIESNEGKRHLKIDRHRERVDP